MIIQWITCIILVIVILILIKFIFKLIGEECKYINISSTPVVITTESDNLPIVNGVLIDNNIEDLHIINL